MSFIVTVYVNEGIVMASDSRISLTSKKLVNDGSDGKPVVITESLDYFSDTAYKTFLMDEKIGISFCGNATINNEPIAGYIESFIREHKGCNVSDVPQKIREYFHTLEPNKSTTFFVAGYETNNTGTKQKVFRVDTIDLEASSIDECDTSSPCAIWDGERAVASRLYSELYIKEVDDNGKEIYTRHKKHDLALSHWTLQDAIEFAEFTISATINSMKFQKCQKTVGGPIDILVLKPEGASWIRRKELHAADSN